MSTSFIKTKRFVGTFLIIVFISIGGISEIFGAGLETVNAPLKTNLDVVGKASSDYFAEHLPFMASLGKNDYRASLKGAGVIPFSLLISVGGGVGLMGGLNEVNEAAGENFIDKGGLPDFIPFIIGPSIYLRVGIPILPLVGNLEIGVKFMPSMDYATDDFDYKNSGFGLDLRYALLRGSNVLIPPALAVGISYDTLKGEFLKTGEIQTSAGDLSAKFGPEWDISNIDIYVKSSAQFFSFVSATFGFALGLRGGDVSTSLKEITLLSDQSGYDDIIGEKSNASGTDMKVLVGITLFVIYIQANYNITTGDAAASGAVTYAF